MNSPGVLHERFRTSGRGADHHIDRLPAEDLLAATIWRIVQPEETRRHIRFDDLAEMPNPDLLPPLDRPVLDETSLTPDQRAWRQDGVLIKKGFLPAHLLEPYIERRSAFRPGTAWNAVGWPDGNCYQGVPELRNVALYPPLMTLLRDLMGEDMLFHLALTGWVSTEREWHQDDYLNPDFINTWYAAVWIALDTIIPESGPFQYVPGSHRWPLLRGEKVRNFLTKEERARKSRTTGINEWPAYAERFVTPAVDDKITQSGLPVKSFLAEKGDLLIWHSRLMHRGSKRTEGWNREGDLVYAKYPRKSLITHYSGINHRPDMVAREQDANGNSYAVFGNELILE